MRSEHETGFWSFHRGPRRANVTLALTVFSAASAACSARTDKQDGWNDSVGNLTTPTTVGSGVSVRDGGGDAPEDTADNSENPTMANPTQFTHNVTGVTEIGAGAATSCAIANGSVYCWGYLGPNGSAGSPVLIPSSRHLEGVSVGSDHSCALAHHGAVCWGQNYNGQLGDGTTTPSDTPVRALNGASSVGAGNDFSCALKGGRVYCWGNNFYGALGSDSLDQSADPILIPGLRRVREISVGDYHVCALVENGRVYCWGYNAFGQLGNNHIECVGEFPAPLCYSAVPVEVEGIEGATAVSVGSLHTCAAVATGIYCWGYNLYGQLGNGTTVDAHLPVRVLAVDDPVRALAAGYGHTCALTNQDLWCWGGMGFGELGTGSFDVASAPVAVQSLLGLPSAIDAGASHTCAIAGNDVYCWGRNQNYQLGSGSQFDSATPVRVGF